MTFSYYLAKEDRFLLLIFSDYKESSLRSLATLLPRPLIWVAAFKGKNLRKGVGSCWFLPDSTMLQRLWGFLSWAHRPSESKDQYSTYLGPTARGRFGSCYVFRDWAATKLRTTGTKPRRADIISAVVPSFRGRTAGSCDMYMVPLKRVMWCLFKMSSSVVGEDW